MAMNQTHCKNILLVRGAYVETDSHKRIELVFTSL